VTDKAAAMLSPGLLVRLTLVAAIWGGTFIAGRVASMAMSAPAAALWRYVLAVLVLLAYVYWREGGLPRLSRAQWLGVTLLGATGVAAYNLCFMFGLERVSASRGSLIVALNPAMTMIGGALFLGEPLTRVRVLGIVLALTGVAIVLGHGNPLGLFEGHAGIGELAMFGCVLAWSSYTLLGKRILAGMSPLVATTYASLTGAALLFLATLVSGDLALPPASPQVWLALCFLGAFGTAVAFVWFYDGVRAIGPARTAIFINLVPVFAVGLGVLLLGEPLEASMLVGGAIVVAGVWLLNRPVAGRTPVATASRAERQPCA
jgi:drug/metabolite transporter (DMT)-like permease